jgi:transcription initiation factor IIE alpha subunit
MLGETEEESPRQSLLRDLKEVEELKEALEALGVKKDSSVAEQLAKESSTRPEIIKILLEDERERLKLKKEYELAMAKEQTSLENYKLTKPIVTEVLGTLKETQGKYNKRATKKGAKVFKALCPHCQSPLTFSKKPVGQFTCPECNKVVKVKSE